MLCSAVDLAVPVTSSPSANMPYLFLGWVAPYFDPKSSSCTKESPLLANVVAPHNKERAELLLEGILHDLDQACYGFVLQIKHLHAD